MAKEKVKYKQSKTITQTGKPESVGKCIVCDEEVFPINHSSAVNHYGCVAKILKDNLALKELILKMKGVLIEHLPKEQKKYINIGYLLRDLDFIQSKDL
jgi:hypothetical protein